MLARQRVPVWIAALFAVNLALIVAPVLEFVIGSPFGQLRSWIALDSEQSLQAWYSSMLWLCAAFLFGLIPVCLWQRRSGALWALASLAAACLVFSIDEILGIHEWIGRKSDVLLPGGDRDATWFDRTGIWPLLLGVPVVVMLALLVGALWRMSGAKARRACHLLIAGLAIMFTGALVIELAKNLVEGLPEESGAALAQVAVEEFFEIAGVTLVVWAAYEFTRAHGIELTVAPREPAPAQVASNPAVTPAPVLAVFNEQQRLGSAGHPQAGTAMQR